MREIVVWTVMEFFYSFWQDLLTIKQKSIFLNRILSHHLKIPLYGYDWIILKAQSWFPTGWYDFAHSSIAEIYVYRDTLKMQAILKYTVLLEISQL